MPVGMDEEVKEDEPLDPFEEDGKIQPDLVPEILKEQLPVPQRSLALALALALKATHGV